MDRVIEFSSRLFISCVTAALLAVILRSLGFTVDGGYTLLFLAAGALGGALFSYLPWNPRP